MSAVKCIGLLAIGLFVGRCAHCLRRIDNQNRIRHSSSWVVSKNISQRSYEESTTAVVSFFRCVCVFFSSRLTLGELRCVYFTNSFGKRIGKCNRPIYILLCVRVDVVFSIKIYSILLSYLFVTLLWPQASIHRVVLAFCVKNVVNNKCMLVK